MRLPARSLVFVAAFAVAASAAHASTVDIDFGGVTSNQELTPTETYSPGSITPFQVENTGTGTNWFLNAAQGDPPPGISTQSGGSSSAPYQLTVSDGGLFVFDSLDLGAFGGTVSYMIEGLDGSTVEFTASGTDLTSGNNGGQAMYTPYVSSGNLSTVAGIDNDITKLVITVYNTTSSDPAYVDNITVTTTPEPNSLILLGTGLIGLGAFARRRFAL